MQPNLLNLEEARLGDVGARKGRSCGGYTTRAVLVCPPALRAGELFVCRHIKSTWQLDGDTLVADYRGWCHPAGNDGIKCRCHLNLYGRKIMHHCLLDNYLLAAKLPSHPWQCLIPSELFLASNIASAFVGSRLVRSSEMRESRAIVADASPTD